MHILEMFLFSLVLTLIIETIVAWLLGVSMHGLKVVWLVNVLTNPPAVCVNWLLGIRFPALPLFIKQLPIEAVVILVETGIYQSFAGEAKWGVRNPIALAVVANLVSYCSGLLLRCI